MSVFNVIQTRIQIQVLNTSKDFLLSNKSTIGITEIQQPYSKEIKAKHERKNEKIFVWNMDLKKPSDSEPFKAQKLFKYFKHVIKWLSDRNIISLTYCYYFYFFCNIQSVKKIIFLLYLCYISTNRFIIKFSCINFFFILFI